MRKSAAAAVGAAAYAHTEAAHGQDKEKRRQPNVLYVFSDQHRVVSLPGEPFSQAIAPNLDAFRRSNFSMETCVSNYPLCTPYRGILMTGRWPYQTGLTRNNIALGTDEISLGGSFKNAGYHTGYVGKWHLSGKHDGFIAKGPLRQGFEDWHVWNATNRHYRSWTYDPDTGEKIQPPGWNCTLMTDQAVAFLHRQPKDRPWLLMVSWNPPHPPFNPPDEDARQYPPERLKFRPNVRLARGGVREKGESKFLASDELLRQAAQGYYGGITGVDLEFARLLKALDDSGQAQDTIVVYTSDHGEMMGSQGRMAKQVPFEESCRVPFFVRYPGVTPAGGKSAALFAAIDIYPTLCGLAGIPVPAGRGGRDLSRILRGQEVPDSPEIVFLMNQLAGGAGAGENDQAEGSAPEDGGGDVPPASHPSYRGARTRTHTYAVMPTGRWCLYDNVTDPYQMNNLIRDPQHRPLMEKLDAMILAWMETTRDPFPYRTAVGKISDSRRETLGRATETLRAATLEREARAGSSTRVRSG